MGNYWWDFTAELSSSHRTFLATPVQEITDWWFCVLNCYSNIFYFILVCSMNHSLYVCYDSTRLIFPVRILICQDNDQCLSLTHTLVSNSSSVVLYIIPSQEPHLQSLVSDYSPPFHVHSLSYLLCLTLAGSSQLEGWPQESLSTCFFAHSNALILPSILYFKKCFTLSSHNMGGQPVPNTLLHYLDTSLLSFCPPTSFSHVYTIPHLQNLLPILSQLYNISHTLFLQLKTQLTPAILY